MVLVSVDPARDTPARLGEYLRDLYALLEEMDLRGIPFGHFGEGCVHIRISFDFNSEPGVARYREFIERAAELVHRYGGSVSGEHGDGRARSELEFLAPEEVLTDLASRLEDLHLVCERTSEVVAERSFSGAAAPRWSEGSSDEAPTTAQTKGSAA